MARLFPSSAEILILQQLATTKRSFPHGELSPPRATLGSQGPVHYRVQWLNSVCYLIVQVASTWLRTWLGEVSLFQSNQERHLRALFNQFWSKKPTIHRVEMGSSFKMVVWLVMPACARSKSMRIILRSLCCHYICDYRYVQVPYVLSWWSRSSITCEMSLRVWFVL